MQVRQVAGISFVPQAFLLTNGDHGPCILSAIRSYRNLPFRLFFKEHFDRVVRVDAPQLGIVAQHFRGNLGRYAVLCGDASLRGSDRGVPFGLLLRLFLLGLRNARSKASL